MKAVGVLPLVLSTPPNSSEVLLTGEFLKGNRRFARDEKGVWSVTVGPIAPEIHHYNFIVDGVRSRYRALTDRHRVKHTFHESDGAHTWMMWRRYLHGIAPLLFR